MSSTPIGDYALVSDCHSAALVSRAGSVDWLCRPRFDSPAIFARLLDDAAGHFSIAPAGDFASTRRYLDRTMVLETTFRTGGGAAVLTDAMALDPTEHGHDLGAGAPRTMLRRIECSKGEVDVEDRTIECPKHGSTFDLETGAPRTLPATVPVATFRVKVEGDRVLIDVED